MIKYKFLLISLFSVFTHATDITIDNLSNDYVSKLYKGMIFSTGEDDYYQSKMKIVQKEKKLFSVTIYIKASNGQHCQIAPGRRSGSAEPITMKYVKNKNHLELLDKKTYGKCDLKLIIEKDKIRLSDKNEYCYKEFMCGVRAHIDNKIFFIKK